MGPFCLTGSNPNHQLTDPTQPNPIQVKKFGPRSRIFKGGDFGNPSEHLGGLGLRENEIARIWLEEGHKTTSK